VVQAGATTTFTATGLTGNTTYTFTVVSYNNTACNGGPVYNNTAPLIGSSASCPATPSTITTSNVTTSSFQLNYTSSKGGGATNPVTYNLEVTTDAAFSVGITGSPFTVSDTTTTQTTMSYTVSGLNPSTIYYYRIKANGCNTTTATGSVSTNCNAINTPYSENFDGATTPNLPLCTSRQDLNGGTTWTTVTAPTGYSGKVLQYTYSISLPADDWFYTQGINLTGGTPYIIGYKYGNNSTGFVEKMEVKYGTSAAASAMINALASHTLINDNTPHVNTVNLTPAASGVYYFGFHANSAADQFYLFLDSITVVAGSALPVTVTSFNAKRNGTVNNITWSTTQEINTSVFVVERSTDGRTFSPIGQVAAAGNSTSLRTYQFTDASPAKAINFYRLKIVDRDNISKFSDVRSVRNTGNVDFTIYPNPVKDVMKVDINADKADKGVMIITDISGKQVYSRQVNVAAGNNTISVDISNITQGAYIIKIQLSDDTIVKKFTKM
jgi:hypothetical protein